MPTFTILFSVRPGEAHLYFCGRTAENAQYP